MRACEWFVLQVSNFTVERDGVGSVRWLRPVDVRGIRLDDIVDIQHGESCLVLLLAL